MIDNTRLVGGQRCSVVLNSFSDQSADITLVLFPGTYASLKEKPYYNEVIENVLNANRLAPEGGRRASRGSGVILLPVCAWAGGGGGGQTSTAASSALVRLV